MTTGTMTQVANEAWTTYQQLSARSADDQKLVETPFKDFTAATGKYDALSDKLQDADATSDTVKQGVDIVTIMDSALSNVAAIMDSFKGKDQQAITATVVDQASAKAKYATMQSIDDNLLAALNTVLYDAQMTVMAAKFGDG